MTDLEKMREMFARSGHNFFEIAFDDGDGSLMELEDNGYEATYFFFNSDGSLRKVEIKDAGLARNKV